MNDGCSFIQPSTKGISVKERVWVNFKELRARLRFEDVLRLYKVEVRNEGGQQHHGPCPLPGHTGSREQPCFSANLKRGIFHCFGCGAKGNVLEFATIMEKADLKDGNDIRKVAVALQERFFPEGAEPEAQARAWGAGGDTCHRKAAGGCARCWRGGFAGGSGQRALEFELRGLDRSHEYFAKHGIKPDSGILWSRALPEGLAQGQDCHPHA